MCRLAARAVPLRSAMLWILLTTVLGPLLPAEPGDSGSIEIGRQEQQDYTREQDEEEAAEKCLEKHRKRNSRFGTLRFRRKKKGEVVKPPPPRSKSTSRLGNIFNRSTADDETKEKKPKTKQSPKVSFKLDATEDDGAGGGDVVGVDSISETDKENCVSIANENGHLLGNSITEVRKTEPEFEEIRLEQSSAEASPKKDSIMPVSDQPLFSPTKKSPDVSSSTSTPSKGSTGGEIECYRDKPIVSFRWRRLLVSGGIFLAVTLLGTSLVSEFDPQAPILGSVRGSSLFINWEDHCYRPLRSLLLGLFH